MDAISVKPRLSILQRPVRTSSLANVESADRQWDATQRAQELKFQRRQQEVEHRRIQLEGARSERVAAAEQIRKEQLELLNIRKQQREEERRRDQETSQALAEADRRWSAADQGQRSSRRRQEQAIAEENLRLHNLRRQQLEEQRQKERELELAFAKASRGRVM